MSEQENPVGSGPSCRVTSLFAEKERRQCVLHEGTPSMTASIADAVIIKDENLFFISQPDGSLPVDEDHGFGLYYHDCRYLSGYQLRMAGEALEPLVSTSARGFMAIVEMANPDMQAVDGTAIHKEEIEVKWVRVLDGDGLALHDSLTFRNFGLHALDFRVSMTFLADFADIFAVRCLMQESPGVVHPPSWGAGTLSFLYEGTDGIYRRTTTRLWTEPESTDGTTATYRLRLVPRQAQEIRVSFSIAESDSLDGEGVGPMAVPDFPTIEAARRRRAEQWLEDKTTVSSNSLLLDGVLHRSLTDLRLLRSSVEKQDFFAAGVPWFAALFGRDSLITALQMLAYDPDIAEETLRVLASYQGTVEDAWREEEPGKILHELRVGELAHIGEIPHSPYYGTVDATPLFLILLARHAHWVGTLDLFRELRPQVEAALQWMETYGGLEASGYLRYGTHSERGLVNQGWKDSTEGIMNADGSLVQPPIALVEAQAYAYLAKTGIADLFRRVGDVRRALELEQQAEDLRVRFNRDFWLEEEGFYALALQQADRPAAVLSSNVGHALWAGIADAAKAERTVERLMGEDMFSGWGIRTLSDNTCSYNPIGYHLGTVWPHDNAIIAAGFRRYGFDDAAAAVFEGIIRATMNFQAYRLPELFAGFRREDYDVPVHYPLASKPQAWAAGTMPSLVETLLGLVPDAFNRRLRVVRPILPAFIQRLEVRDLRVARSRVDLRFEGTSDGVSVQLLGIKGNVDVVVEL